MENKIDLTRVIDVLRRQHDGKYLIKQMDASLTHMFTDGYAAGHTAASLDTWIPCEEYLPATDDFVLVLGVLKDGSRTWGKGRYHDGWVSGVKDITHWRPAPEVGVIP